jgi:1-acyl-sn-glycerol-3-phosphate acyltransferase
MLKKLAFKWFKRSGWELTGHIPGGGRILFVYGPHTSRFDLIYGLGAMYAAKIHVRIFADISYDFFPISTILRPAGVRFLDIEKREEFHAGLKSALNRNPKLNIALNPKGTMKSNGNLTPFFREVAIEHGFQIVPVGIDYERKKIKVFSSFHPSVSEERDMKFVRESLSVFTGKHTEGNIRRRG